jgi:hypothetical protein
MKLTIGQRRGVFMMQAMLIFLGFVFGLMPTTASAASVRYCEQQYAIYGGCETECPSSSSGGSGGPAKPTASGDGGGCGNDANGDKANQDQVWGYFNNKFMQAGYSKDEAEQATAGIMGNWLQESAFNSYRTDGVGCTGASGPITGNAGMGIAQWCGGRQQALSDFATERGTEWTCLGTQLEFTWKEMEERDLIATMKGNSPAEASHNFDKIFEVSDGSGEREKKGEQMYQEYTGKDPGKLSPTPSGGVAGASCGAAAGSEGGIPGPQCAQALPAFQEAVSSGKIEVRENVEKDMENCSDGDFKYCTPGAQAVTFRGLAAAANNSGVESIGLNNINEDHSCDEMDHPNGLATDIEKCNGKAANSDEAACFALVDYLIENKEELNIRYIIWDGSYCQQKLAGSDFGECRSDHNNHVHVSFNGDKNGYNE